MDGSDANGKGGKVKNLRGGAVEELGNIEENHGGDRVLGHKFTKWTQLESHCGSDG